MTCTTTAAGILAAMPEEDLAEAAKSLSQVRPAVLRRLVALIRQPGLARLLQ